MTDYKPCKYCGRNLCSIDKITDSQIKHRTFCDVHCKEQYRREHIEEFKQHLSENNSFLGDIPRGSATKEEVWQSIKEWRDQLKECRIYFQGMRKRINKTSSSIANREYRASLKQNEPELYKQWLANIREKQRQYAREKRIKNCRRSAKKLNNRYIILKDNLISQRLATEKNMWAALIMVVAINKKTFCIKSISKELKVIEAVFINQFHTLTKEGFIIKLHSGRYMANMSPIIKTKLKNGDLKPWKAICEIGGDVDWL